MKKTTIILTVMLTLAFLAPGLYFYAEDQIEAEVLTTIFAALATVIGVMWTHTLAKKREMQNGSSPTNEAVMADC